MATASPKHVPALMFGLAAFGLLTVGMSVACGFGGASGSADGSASGLPDLRKGIQTGMCEEVNGSRIPGADSHFFGDLAWSADTFTGSEEWALNANSAWKERGGNDCSIKWRVTGSKVPVTTCGDCTYGLHLTAAPEINSSDCPEELVKREAKPQELRYDVKTLPDGSLFVYYAKSGRLMAEGYHQDGALNYRTQHQCKWF